MKDLNKTLEIYLNKTLKIIKKVDRVINGAEKQLVLEVGSHTTKIIEYMIKKDNIEVVAGAILNTPVNSVREDILVDTSVLANMLTQTMHDEKIKTKEVVVSIVSKDIITREMNVPPMQEKDLKKFVQINSSSIFPVKLINYVLAYNIIEKGATNRVMIAAIPKAIVESYIALTDELGLNLKGINYSGYELYNFLDFEIDLHNSSYLAIDLGAKNTNIVIISNGTLKFNKIVPKGFEETSINISEELNCTLMKAEQLKRQYNTLDINGEAVPNSEEEVVARYSRRALDGIMQDVTRIMEFFNSNNQKNKISKIYIIGAACKMKGIEEYFTNKLNVAAVSLKNLSKVTFGKDAFKLKTRHQNFLNCFGAHQLKDRNFYFIKGDLKFRKLPFILKGKFHKMMLCIILIFTAIIIMNNNKLTEIEKNYDIYNQYINENSGVVNLQRQIDGKKNELIGKEEQLNKLGVGMEKHLNVLTSLEAEISKLEGRATIVVTKYKFSRNSIQIIGNVVLPPDEEQTAAASFKYGDVKYELSDGLSQAIGKEVKSTASTTTGFTFEVNLGE